MGLMRNRPLACCCLVFLITLTVASQVSSLAKLCLGGAALLFLTIFAIFNRQHKRSILFSLTCVVLALLALFYGHLRFDRYFDLAHRYPGEVTITARVREVTYEGGRALGLTVDCEQIDGQAQSGRLAVWAYADEEIVIGDRITFDGTLLELSKDDPLSLYLQAKGIAAQAEDVYHLTVTPAKKRPVDMLRSTFSTLRQSLGTQLHTHVPGDGGALMRALLLGEQDLLPDTAKRDFRRTGLSHVLSLSGLHVSLLLGTLALLCRHLRISRVICILSQILLVLFYMALTGFSLSIVRAGLMTLFVSLSFFARREADGMTSLAFAAALIALFSPTAVYDCGYWLSITATMGILVYNELHTRSTPPAAWHLRLLHGAGNSLAITLAANFATLPLLAFFFGEFSWLAPLCNLLLIPFFNLYLLMAAVALPFGMLPPVGAVSSALGEFLLSSIAQLSKLRGICVPIDHIGIRLLLACLAIFLFALLFFTRIGKRRMLSLGIISLALFGLCLGVTGLQQLTTAGVYYAYTGTNEALLVKDGPNSILCDLSSGSYTAQKNGLRTTEAAHMTELDGYLITHYHTRHATSLPRLCGQILIRTLYLPIPQSEEEEAIYRSLAATAATLGMDCRLYEPYKDIALGGMTLHPHAYGKSEAAHPAIALSVRRGENLLTYLGSGYHESDGRGMASSAVEKSTALIFGLHGPREKKLPDYPRFSKDLTTVILPGDDRIPPALAEFLSFRCRAVTEEETVYIPL